MKEMMIKITKYFAFYFSGVSIVYLDQWHNYNWITVCLSILIGIAIALISYKEAK